MPPEYKAGLSMAEDPEVVRVKAKIKEHLEANDLSLGMLFAYMDKDSSGGMTLQEMQERGLGKILAPDELRLIFNTVDRDRSGEISQEELITELSLINCQFVLKKLKKTIEGAAGALKGGKTPYDEVFDTVDTNKSLKDVLTINEFNDLITMYESNVPKYEVDSLFRHFDKNGDGRITRQNFIKAFTEPLSLDNGVKSTASDIFLPLQTRLKKLGFTCEQLWDKSARNPSMMTIDEFA